eukprot:2874134-Pleurochrysis_carterae.AAC.1
MQLAGCRAMTSSIENPTQQAAIAPMLVDNRSARSDSADAFQTHTRTGQWSSLATFAATSDTHIAPIVRRKL